MSGSTPVIELRDVHVTHRTRTGSLLRPGRVHAVRGVDFAVSRGETVGIVGESGCGKSTLARVMVGLQVPSSGQVIFAGTALGHSAADRRRLGRAVSVVFQDPATALNPRMFVADVLSDPLKVHGIGTPASRAARVRELLELVGLPASARNVLPRQISGGQRQRVAIARALALEPEVIVADELTSALDVSVRAQVLNLLGDLKERLGLGMVFISHDINTVRHVSDRIAVMNAGVIVETGGSADVFAHPRDEYTRTLLRAAPTLLQGTGDLDAGALGLNAPGPNAPGPNAPGPNAPDTNAPGLNAPGLNAPGPNAPDTNAPGADGLGTNAPDTNGLGTGDLRTGDPRTDDLDPNAPDTNDPDPKEGPT